MLIVFFSGTVLTILLEYTLTILNAGKPTSSIEPNRYLIIREHEPNFKTIVQQSDEFIKETDSLKVRGVPFEVDEESYIKPSRLHKKAKLNIYFLGGSTTENIQVLPEFRFPFLVGRHLEKRTKVQINTFNGGVGGSHSVNAIINLFAKIVDKNPDIVVLKNVWNDMAMYFLANGYRNTSIRGVLGELKNTNRINSLRAFKNLVYSIVPNIYISLINLKNLIYREQSSTDEHAGKRNINKDLDWNNFYIEFERNLRLFIAMSKIWEIKPILMTQANRLQLPLPPELNWSLRHIKKYGVYPEELIEIYNNATKIIRKVATETETTLIDLENLIPKSKIYMYDIMHYTDEGSILAAKEITKKLTPIVEEILQKK